MKHLILAAALLALAACETTTLGGSFTFGNGEASVSPTISGTSGNTRGTLSLDL